MHCEGFIEQVVSQNTGGVAQDKPIALFAATGGATAPAGCVAVGDFRTVFGNKIPQNQDTPGMAFRGALRWKRNADPDWTYIRNGGHLGSLEDPSGASKIRGHNIFSRTPIQVDARRM